MINSIHLIGNVGQDPQIRTTQTGKKVATFSIATSESYKDTSGARVTNTTWHNIVAWDPLAGIVESYVKKGAQLYIEGKMTYRTYDDKDGNKHNTAEVVAHTLQMLGKREQAANEGPDDLPFP